MFRAFFRPLFRRGWRRAALFGVGVAAVAGSVWFGRGLVHRADAQPPAASVPAPASTSTTPAASSDYASRVVAYIHQSQAITRQDLGEYLIARHGADKVPLLVNKRILDEVCRSRGIVVTAAEVDAELNGELKGLAIDRGTFIKTVLSRYKKNLYEFKEDILRPRLQLTRLCQARITVDEEDLRKAFESAYGEKVECRVILWPLKDENKAYEQYNALRDSETAFAEKAKSQDSELAASGGRINPISRWSMDAAIEKAAFELRPGQVSTLLKTPQGIVMLKCDKRIPADTSVNIAAVKDKIEVEIRERKLHLEMAKVFQTQRDLAKPSISIQKLERAAAGAAPVCTDAVAWVNGNAVTREELGEFLIARLGGEKLEFLVNRCILERACKERNVTVTDDEVEQAFESDLKQIKMEDKKTFEKELLTKWGKSLFEWREDVVKPRLILTKMCQGRVKVTEDEIRKGFEAYHGERLACRMILWPKSEGKHAMRIYAQLRDSEEEFSRAARNQSSPTLAAEGGKLPVFGRHSLGDENLEREAFRLQKGECSPLIGTPQGQVMLKCDERFPPKTDTTLEKERAELVKEITNKKTQIEMQVVFKELRDQAAPRMLLAGTGQPEDLAAEAKKLMSDLPPIGGGQTKK